MPGRRRRTTGVGDSLLNKLWRKAVLASWNYRDPISGRVDPSGESLQCHHIVYRRHYLLRWDVRNGVPLTAESHYAVHHDIGARRRLEELVNLAYLEDMGRWTKKDYLLKYGMSDAEFRALKKRELEMVIRSNEDG
jgi:hypothetical protein